MSTEEEYTRLLKQFPEKLQGALTWKKYFERLVHAGRRTGRTDIEIGDDIRKELKGQLADSTVRTYLPSSFKHMEHASEHKEPLNFGGSLEIKPPSQRIVEIQPEALAEAKRFVDNTIPERPIAVPQKIVKIIFDPAPIDRDRTQVFIIHFDKSLDKIKKYETVGRRSIGR